MEALLRKYFWIVPGGLLAVAALIAAAGVNSLAASFLAEFAVALPDSASTESRSAADDNAVELTDLPPNIFGAPEEEAPVDLCATVTCSEGETCNPASGVCEPDPALAEAAGSGDGRCVTSDIALTLVGTQVAADSSWSMAVLHNPAVNRTQFARQGTTLLAEADVLRIERNRVIIRRNGREECIRFAGEGTPAGAPALARGPSQATTANRITGAPGVAAVGEGTGAAAEAPRATGGTIEERIQSGVRRNRDGSYDVDRTLVQEVANNQQLLEQEAPRVVPNVVNGEPQGYRLQGIRSGSMFSRIGIRNGDVITRVGTTEIDSPQRALELYQQMMNQSQVSVTVIRRGREQTLTYNIR